MGPTDQTAQPIQMRDYSDEALGSRKCLLGVSFSPNFVQVSKIARKPSFFRIRMPKSQQSLHLKNFLTVRGRRKFSKDFQNKIGVYQLNGVGIPICKAPGDRNQISIIFLPLLGAPVK
jgi:hypothetical protein